MSRPDPEFRSFQKVKEVQAWAIDLTREKTRAVYVTALWRYWRNYLSKTYSSLWEWIVAVKSAYRSDDNVIRKSWALELKSWMNGYVSEVTKQPLQTSSK